MNHYSFFFKVGIIFLLLMLNSAVSAQASFANQFKCSEQLRDRIDQSVKGIYGDPDISTPRAYYQYNESSKKLYFLSKTHSLVCDLPKSKQHEGQNSSYQFQMPKEIFETEQIPILSINVSENYGIQYGSPGLGLWKNLKTTTPVLSCKSVVDSQNPLNSQLVTALRQISQFKANTECSQDAELFVEKYPDIKSYIKKLSDSCQVHPDPEVKKATAEAIKELQVLSAKYPYNGSGASAESEK